MLRDKEARVDALVEKQQELEDALQAACEESVAVAQVRKLADCPSRDTTRQHAHCASTPQLARSQDALRCLMPNHVGVGAVQLAAAGVLSSMAQAQHPVARPSIEDPSQVRTQGELPRLQACAAQRTESEHAWALRVSQVFVGPFRSLLTEANVLPDLLRLARSPCCGAPHLAHCTRMLVANAALHLSATEEPLTPLALVECCAYLADAQQPLAAQQHLAGMFWCLTRHESNR